MTKATKSEKAWDTTVKLGAIEEAQYVALGAVVSKIDKATGEITLRTVGERQPHGRSAEVIDG